MKFPAYGRALWNRRLLGARPRVVALLVGDDWSQPKWIPAAAKIPRLAVKNAAWHESGAERFDWRVVAACSVLAIDRRLPGERARSGEWDSWFWLLADVQRYAQEIIMFTPVEPFIDPPGGWALERYLDVYAWCVRAQRPPWWPTALADRFRPAA